VQDGTIPPSPPLDAMDFSLMDNDVEWALLMDNVLTFAQVRNAGGGKRAKCHVKAGAGGGGVVECESGGGPRQQMAAAVGTTH